MNLSADVSAVHVREFASADRTAVAELFAEGMNSYPAHQNAYNTEYVASCLRDDLADIEGSYAAKGGNFWVATLRVTNEGAESQTGEQEQQREEEEVVGMIGLERLAGDDGRELVGELRRLSIRSDCKHHGIGRLLTSHLEHWARQRGFARINLSTGIVMHEAIAFYTKLGYRFVGEEPESPEYMLACFTKEL